MTEYAVDPEHVVASEEALRQLFPPVHTLAALKSQSELDAHARAFIARSPFLCIGTQSADGKADVSPRGDPRGFVRVLDGRTLAIPDRPGNNRLDTLVNIIANPSVGLLFMVPGYDETLRINGTARLVTAPHLLETMRVNDRVPRLAILVTVKEVFLHCAKAFRRSHLWDPEHRQDRSEMPSLMQMLLEQTTGAPTEPTEIAKRDQGLEDDYRRSLY
jgi:PPOX class probable FMN-dependent enzyme